MILFIVLNACFLSQSLPSIEHSFVQQGLKVEAKLERQCEIKFAHCSVKNNN